MCDRQFARFCNSIILIVLCIAAMPPCTLASARVEPSKFIFYAEQGEPAVGAIDVTNIEDTENEYKAVLYDWTLGENDDLIISPPRESARKP